MMVCFLIFFLLIFVFKALNHLNVSFIWIDLAMRMIAENVCVKRPNPLYSIYKMAKHVASEKNPIREKLLFSSIKRMSFDGLAQIDTANVSIVSVDTFFLFTLLKIDVGTRSSDYFSKY